MVSPDSIRTVSGVGRIALAAARTRIASRLLAMDAPLCRTGMRQAAELRDLRNKEVALHGTQHRRIQLSRAPFYLPQHGHGQQLLQHTSVGDGCSVGS